jgi:hypothetical protein
MKVRGPRVLMAVCAVGVLLVIMSAGANADDWIGGSGLVIGALEPLAVAEGGAVRIVLTSPINVPYCGNSSGQASYFDVLYTNGTQESRAALVSGLYVALAAGKSITLLLSSAACSPYAAPEVVGIHVNQ